MSRHEWQKRLNTGRWRIRILRSLSSPFTRHRGPTWNTSLLPGTDQQQHVFTGTSNGEFQSHSLLGSLPMVPVCKAAGSALPSPLQTVKHRDFRASCRNVYELRLDLWTLSFCCPTGLQAPSTLPLLTIHLAMLSRSLHSLKLSLLPPSPYPPKKLFLSPSLLPQASIYVLFNTQKAKNKKLHPHLISRPNRASISHDSGPIVSWALLSVLSIRPCNDKKLLSRTPYATRL